VQKKYYLVDKMKVLQINTVSGFGSTGGICIDLANALQRQGHECYIAYGQFTTDYVNSFKVGSKLENHIHNACSRITGKQGYFTKNGTTKLIRYIESLNPDVIHLHNLHGNYLNLELLFNYLALANKPVVWTLHDCWAFTGKCSYYTDIECNKWQTHCNHCPQVKKYPPSIYFDRSSVMFEDKKKWFTSIENMTIVPVSNWLAGEVRQSFLAKYPIVPIYNWIDQTIFKPSGINTRKKFGIDENKFIILSVGASWTANNNKLIDSIRLSQLISDDMQIVLVGDTKKLDSIPENIIHIPYVNSSKELAEIYSMGDVYVHMSVEDTFGKVIAEAMSCGTPVIVFNSTACPEVIGEGCGYVVEKRDIDAIFINIQVIKDNGKHYYTKNCIRHVQNNFDAKQKIDQTIQLYNSL